MKTLSEFLIEREKHCVQCDNDQEFEDLTGNLHHDVVCGVCGWKIAFPENMRRLYLKGLNREDLLELLVRPVNPDRVVIWASSIITEVEHRIKKSSSVKHAQDCGCWDCSTA